MLMHYCGWAFVLLCYQSLYPLPFVCKCFLEEFKMNEMKAVSYIIGKLNGLGCDILWIIRSLSWWTEFLGFIFEFPCD